MKRLTTDKEASEMSMVELAHNSCYAKENKARYRDYGMDIDVRELTIGLLGRFADIPNEFTCDDDFDDFMLDSLQYGMEDMLGLIAAFYQNLWAMANLRQRLKEYEDLEEQGLLLKLPCKVGDAVYVIDQKHNECEWACEEYDLEGSLVAWCEKHCPHGYKGMGVIKTAVKKIEITKSDIYIITEKCGRRDIENTFFTQAEAEESLRKRGGLNVYS